MLNRVVLVVVLVPLAIVMIALAVANRAPVPFTLDPFNPGNPGLTVSLPLFVWLLAALALGVFVGGAATWMRQGRYRRIARQHIREAERLREASDSNMPAVPRPRA